MEETGISEAINELNNKITSIQAVQHLLLTVLIGSSEPLKERIKVAINEMLKHKDFLNLQDDMIGYLQDILDIADHSDSLKNGRKAPSLFEIIQGGKQDTRSNQ